ncbi:MAG: AsmA family protein [Variibacter sp.]|nr:AsmA family protein [Variibacter sp.]
MKPLSGLKRLAFGLVAVVAAALGAFAAMPFLVQADAVRESVQAEIRYATGVDPILRGDMSVSLFPAGSASFDDVVLSDEAGGPPVLAAERLIAQLRLLPLLLGRIEVSEITLIRPRILIDFDTEGRSNWADLVAQLAETVKPANRARNRVTFSEIRLVGGAVTVRDASRSLAETFEQVEMSLAWPSISRSFAATGHFVWRGEKLDATFTLSDFLAALVGERSGFKARLTGALLKLGFDGHISSWPTLKIEGAMAADGPSLRKVMDWVGLTPLPGGGFGRFALNAQTSVVDKAVAFTGLNIEVDGNAAEGVLSLTAGARPHLQGTLAAEEIDIAPYLANVQVLTGNEREWNRVPIRLDGLAAMELDVRLSAARVTVGSTRIGRTALAANLRDGRFVLTIGESQAFDGIAKGVIGLARASDGARLNAQLQFANVDLEKCLSLVFGVRKIEGRGDLTLALEGTGNDVLELTRTLNGAASLVATKGALIGLNLEQLLRRLERRPLSGGGDFRNGRTPFDRLAIAVKIVDGMASVEDVSLEGSAVRLALDGSASIPARDLDLKGTASLIGASVKESGGFELPFVVRGRWDDPIMLPDAQSLIRRSGAAAPLLEAVRGGRARDAVRSAIEQLTTRGSESPLAVAPASPNPNASRE